MTTHSVPVDGTTSNPQVHIQEHTRWVQILGLAVGLAALLSLLTIAFAWPATQIAPRNVPLVVAGPPEAAAQVRAALETAAPGGFAVTVVGDESAARSAVERRDAYGAVILGSPTQPPTVLTASGASPVVAQALGQLGLALAARQPGAAAPTVRVVDVVPTPASDPRGTGLAALALPLVIGGIAVGAASTRAVSRMRRRAVAVALAAGLAGLALAGIAHAWLGILGGTWWVEAAVIALGIAAIGFTLVGLDALLGTVGLVLGIALVMLIGNPLSGMTSAPELLPAGWGALGQWLPPGATGTLLRTVSYFPDASPSPAVWILVGWVLVGALLSWVGSRRHPVVGRHEDGVGSVGVPQPVGH